MWRSTGFKYRLESRVAIESTNAYSFVPQVIKSLRDFMGRGADFAIVAMATTAEFAA